MAVGRVKSTQKVRHVVVTAWQCSDDRQWEGSSNKQKVSSSTQRCAENTYEGTQWEGSSNKQRVSSGTQRCEEKT